MWGIWSNLVAVRLVYDSFGGPERSKLSLESLWCISNAMEGFYMLRTAQTGSGRAMSSPVDCALPYWILCPEASRANGPRNGEWMTKF